MDIESKLIEELGNFYGVDTQSLNKNFLLSQGKGSGSLGRVKLDALLRKLNIFHPNIYTIKTLDELMSFSDKDKASIFVPGLNTESDDEKIKKCIYNSTQKVGVDIEVVSRFPMVDDFWENQFYRDNFSSNEISYCIKQENPQEHLAGRWCAKEAVIKCSEGLHGIKLCNIEIFKDERNKLSVIYRNNNHEIKLPFEVSISHSGGYAAAVAISLVNKNIDHQQEKLTDRTEKQGSTPDRKKMNRLVVLLSGCLSIAILYIITSQHWFG